MNDKTLLGGRASLQSKSLTKIVAKSSPKNQYSERRSPQTVFHQLSLQLQILGYKEGDRVYIRALLPKNIPMPEALKLGMAWEPEPGKISPVPIDGYLTLNQDRVTFTRLKRSKESGKWIERRTYQDGIAYLTSINIKGYALYYVVNAGGRENGDITRCPALFYECDGISKDEQWEKVDELTRAGYEPSLVIETRNSLHVYHRTFEQGADGWRELQQRLIQRQDSDPSIHNENRLMRLAGFFHWKWSSEAHALESFLVELRLNTVNIYSRAELDALLPEWDCDRWETTHRTSERVESDPSLDPWDIRNLATLLDGFNPNGRRGWITCKCPSHNGQSDNSLHIEQATGAHKCHSGCNSKDIYHSAVELAKSRGYQLPEKHTEKYRSNLDGWLFNFKKQIAKTIAHRKPWGVGSKDEVEPTPQKDRSVIEYEPGKRLHWWAEIHKTHQEVGDSHHRYDPEVFKVIPPLYILDTSGTGSGKSFDAGMVTGDMFGCKQAIYISAEHRNTSTSTLSCWADLEPRHEGLAKDEFGKLRRIKKGDPYSIPPNCSRTETIGALRSRNVAGADTSERICAGCAFLETCKGGVGNYDYLNHRAKTISQERFKGHQDSLPSADTYDYSDKALIWDEAGESIKTHRSIEVQEQDLNIAIARLALKLPSAWETLRPLLNVLHQYLSGQLKEPGRYGLDDTALRALLPKVEDIDVAAIASALSPDLSFLNTVAKHDAELADLPRHLRKKFSDSDRATSEKVREQVALNWLPDFLNVLFGIAKGGSLRLQYGVLTVTIPDLRLVEIVRSAKVNIFLDATLAREDLSRTLGIDPETIFVTRQKQLPANNLEIIQVATVGRLGVGARRKDEKGNDTFLQQRISTLTDHIKNVEAAGKRVAVIDFKKFAKQGERSWWVDSRGINDLEKTELLVLVGTPCRNLADLAAEFTVLYGRVPKEGKELVKYLLQVKGQPALDLQPYFEMEVSSDPDFREFCRRRILADIDQGIGRLRADRRPGEQLKVYFIADYPLDREVTLKKASDLTPDAATKTERVEMAIRGAVQQLKDAGKKVTQDALAALTGYSQQYISRFRILLQTLLNPSNSICSKNSDPPPDSDDLQWASDKYLPILADSPPTELLEGVLATFEAYGASAFKSIWDATPAAAQVKILKALMFTLNAGELRSLFTCVTTT